MNCFVNTSILWKKEEEKLINTRLDEANSGRVDSLVHPPDLLFWRKFKIIAKLLRNIPRNQTFAKISKSMNATKKNKNSHWQSIFTIVDFNVYIRVFRYYNNFNKHTPLDIPSLFPLPALGLILSRYRVCQKNGPKIEILT